MIRGAARDEPHLLERARGLGPERNAVEGDRPVVRQPAHHRLLERAGLLVDLLQHEVGVPALLGGLRVPVDAHRRARDAPPAEAADRRRLARQHRHLAVLDHEHVAGVRQERGDIRGQQRLALSDPDDQRADAAHGHDPARFVRAHHHERVRAPGPGHGLLHRGGQIAAVRVLDQVRQHLGVRLGPKPVAARHQVVLQREKVLDDPVVNHHDTAAAVDVRVRVLVGRVSVRGPPGVPDPDVAVDRMPLHELREAGELARRLAHLDAAAVHDGDACGIVAAVLQPAQAVQQDRHSRPLTNIAHDAAHTCLRNAPWPTQAHAEPGAGAKMNEPGGTRGVERTPARGRVDGASAGPPAAVLIASRTPFVPGVAPGFWQRP